MHTNKLVLLCHFILHLSKRQIRNSQSASCRFKLWTTHLYVTSRRSRALTTQTTIILSTTKWRRISHKHHNTYNSAGWRYDLKHLYLAPIVLLPLPHFLHFDFIRNCHTDKQIKWPQRCDTVGFNTVSHTLLQVSGWIQPIIFYTVAQCSPIWNASPVIMIWKTLH